MILKFSCFDGGGGSKSRKIIQQRWLIHEENIDEGIMTGGEFG
jgi:hypothetical protein